MTNNTTQQRILNSLDTDYYKTIVADESLENPHYSDQSLIDTLAMWLEDDVKQRINDTNDCLTYDLAVDALRDVDWGKLADELWVRL